MIRLLLPLILVILALVLAQRYIVSAPPEAKPSRKITVLLVGLFIVLLILTILHRMHWLAAIVPAVILFLRKVFSSISPVFQPKSPTSHSREQHTTQEPPPSAQSTGNAAEDEALNVLGLHRPYTREEVVEAHRKLMQKFHPDRGGNDYFAARINDAKQLLLRNS